MPWKVDDNGSIAVDDSQNPVWVYSDGKEAGFNAESALKKISELGAEAKDHRLNAKAANEKLTVLTEGGVELENLSDWFGEATKAIETVKSFDDKQLVEAGEIETIKRGVAESYESKLTEQKKSLDAAAEVLKADNAKKDAHIRELMIEGAFHQSDFISERLSIPADIAYAKFGPQFQIEEGTNGKPRVIATDFKGDKIMSLKNAGEYAEPEEAIALLIDGYPRKDDILRQDGSGSGGSGTITKQDGAIRLSREQAKDTQIYRQASERAAKDGVPLIVDY